MRYGSVLLLGLGMVVVAATGPQRLEQLMNPGRFEAGRATDWALPAQEDLRWEPEMTQSPWAVEPWDYGTPQPPAGWGGFQGVPNPSAIFGGAP
jgi:hypothetical protein